MATNSMTRLQKAINLCHVPRWVIVPLLRPQTVAEHSFRVAMIARRIAELLKWSSDRTVQLLEAALDHDIEEAITGDLPATTKLAFTRDKELGELYVITKIADVMEAYEYLNTWGNPSERRHDIMLELDRKLSDWIDFYEQQWSVSIRHIVGDVGTEITRR